jgi:hypothetical protein
MRGARENRRIRIAGQRMKLGRSLSFTHLLMTKHPDCIFTIKKRLEVERRTWGSKFATLNRSSSVGTTRGRDRAKMLECVTKCVVLSRNWFISHSARASSELL